MIEFVGILLNLQCVVVCQKLAYWFATEAEWRAIDYPPSVLLFYKNCLHTKAPKNPTILQTSFGLAIDVDQSTSLSAIGKINEVFANKND